MAPKARTTRAQILELLNQGMTRKQAAEFYGVTPQTVHYHLRYATEGPEYSTPLELAHEHIPWEVESGHKRAMQYKMLLFHLKWTVAAGEGLSENEKGRLRRWYEDRVRYDDVVEYDPSTEPYHGNRYGGFRLVPRGESDADLLIHVNEHTRLGDETYVYFRLPDQWPGE